MSKTLFDNSVIREAQEGLDFMGNVLEASTEYSIIGKDLDGKILLWNEGARRMYGYEAGEVVGIANSEILHTPEDVAQDKPREIMDAALREGKLEGVIHRVRKDRRRITARIVITPRRDETGEPIGFLLISKEISHELRFAEELRKGVFAAARDVTERKRFEQTLQEKNVELENASLAKDRFLANMSHELRTPLNAIIGFTGTLLMGLPGPLNLDQTEQLGTIENSATHLLSLINDLLDLAKIESGKVELRREPIVCQSVVQEVLTTLRPIAEAKSLRMEAALPPHDLVVQTDRRALTQILLNLTNNAIKFTEKGEIRIEVASQLDDGQTNTLIRVIDTGIGIRAEDQVRLFQAFEQVHGHGKARQQGTGLGLHLSQKLSELLDGRISMQSEFGKGSTFTLTLKASV